MGEGKPRTSRVAVADQRRFIAEAVAALIATMPGFEVTGVIVTEQALRAVGAHKPDVVLVGVAGAPLAGLSSVGLIRAGLPTVDIVLLADSLEPELVKFVLDQRLSGLLLTDLPGSDIAMCLDQVAHGRAVLPSGWQSVLANRPLDPLGSLSSRQMEVLELLAQGFSYEEIAAQLFISVNTVKFHVRSIFSHLGVRNRLAAARLLDQRAGQPLRDRAATVN